MVRRSSKLLPLLFAALVGGVALAAWLVLRDPSVSADTTAVGPEPVTLTTSTGSESVAAPGGAEETAAESDDRPAAAAQSSGGRREQETLAETELKQGRWVSGRVVLPAETPRGEVVEVVALGRKFKGRDQHRVRIEPDGSFRVAFAAGTTTGRLDIDAPHLFLDKPRTLRLAKLDESEEIVLEPFLGGALRGRLKLPPGSDAVARELVGKTVRANAWSMRWSDMVVRTGKVDAELCFELRGLPPELGLDLTFDSGVVTTLSVSEFRAPAGETVERDFELALGARVRGKVVSPGSALPKNVQLVASTKGESQNMFGGGREASKVEPDGSFDLRGLSPGEITLTVSAPQRVTQKLELGRLENGALKEGVELVLGLGHQVSGRVLWPDRTPAVEAQVVASGGGSDDDPFNPFDSRFTVRTNANGEFQIAGLNEGPYSLQAQAKPPADDGTKKRRGPTWKARIENVAADTHGMEVVLVAGYSIEGLVVDDVGAPVTAFGVVATAKDEGKASFNLSRMVTGMFKPEDGRFELGGLLEGGYTIRLNVPGHDDPEALDVSVPSDGTTYTFVAPRRAAISGMVVKPDGSPAVRAEVSVTGKSGRWSDAGQDKTDNHGRFEITSAETGAISLTARLDGFAPSEPFAAEVVGGQSIRDLRLVLRVGGTITGEVLPSRKGERVDARRVTAQMSDGEDYDTTTDRQGRFRFDHVAPGHYQVNAEAAPTELDALRGDTSGDRRDWELVELTKKRGQADVSDGGSAHVVLGAPPANPVSISGRVHRGSQGVAGMRVIAQPETDRGWERRTATVTDDTGRYELVIDGAGRCQVQLQSGGRNSITQGKHVEVPAEGLTGVDFELPAGVIGGKVEGPDGEELGWVRVQLVRIPGSTEQASSWTSGNASTDQEGRFEFKDLPPGAYTLEVSGNSWNRRTFEQRQYGMVKLDLSLGEGQVMDDLRIQLVVAGSLHVTVLQADGTPADNGMLTVRRTDSNQSNFAALDDSWFQNGESTRQDLEPGTYEISASSGELVSSAPERVTILSSQTTEATVRLRPGGRIVFRAVDAQGSQVAAMGTLLDRSGRALGSSRPLRQGEVSNVLPPGEYRIVGRNEAGATAEGSATVKVGETVDLTVTFP